MRALIGLILGFVATGAFATPEQVNRDFRALQHVEADYRPFGTVCEEVAKLRLAGTYPAPEYKIEVGIGYNNSHRQLGELDVVVIRTRDNEAVLIAEVKCWKDLSAARRKAEAQLGRFRGHLEGGTNMTMYSMKDRNVRFGCDQFDERPEYIKVSQDGGERAGFELTIGLSLEEAAELRDRLMDCQNSGHCVRPY